MAINLVKTLQGINTGIFAAIVQIYKSKFRKVITHGIIKIFKSKIFKWAIIIGAISLINQFANIVKFINKDITNVEIKTIDLNKEIGDTISSAFEITNNGIFDIRKVKITTYCIYVKTDNLTLTNPPGSTPMHIIYGEIPVLNSGEKTMRYFNDAISMARPYSKIFNADIIVTVEYSLPIISRRFKKGKHFIAELSYGNALIWKEIALSEPRREIDH